MTIYKGDAINLPFTVKIGDQAIKPQINCADLEIAIGEYIKKYSDDEIYYDEGKWYFPLSQEETFNFKTNSVPVQVRVLLADGLVRGVNADPIKIVQNISKEVLTDE